MNHETINMNFDALLGKGVNERDLMKAMKLIVSEHRFICKKLIDVLAHNRVDEMYGKMTTITFTISMHDHENNQSWWNLVMYRAKDFTCSNISFDKISQLQFQEILKNR